MPLQRYFMHVSGKAEPPIAYMAEPEAQVEKLGEMIGPDDFGPPHFHSLEPMIGRVLEVIDHPSEGIVRRTFWRLP